MLGIFYVSCEKNTSLSYNYVDESFDDMEYFKIWLKTSKPQNFYTFQLLPWHCLTKIVNIFLHNNLFFLVPSFYFHLFSNFAVWLFARLFFHPRFKLCIQTSRIITPSYYWKKIHLEHESISYIARSTELIITFLENWKLILTVFTLKLNLKMQWGGVDGIGPTLDGFDEASAAAETLISLIEPNTNYSPHPHTHSKAFAKLIKVFLLKAFFIGIFIAASSCG